MAVLLLRVPRLYQLQSLFYHAIWAGKQVIICGQEEIQRSLYFTIVRGSRVWLSDHVAQFVEAEYPGG